MNSTWLDALNLLASCGILWKLIDFSRAWGQLEQKVEVLWDKDRRRA